MGNHVIVVHTTGGTDAIKHAANEFVTAVKKVATVTGATVTCGASQRLEGLSTAVGEAEFGGDR